MPFRFVLLLVLGVFVGMTPLSTVAHAQSGTDDPSEPMVRPAPDPGPASTNHGRADAPSSARAATDSDAPRSNRVPTDHGRSTSPKTVKTNSADGSTASFPTNQGRTRETVAAESARMAVPKAVGDGSVRLSQMGPNGDPLYDAMHPAVVYNSGSDQYFVVWTGTDDSGSLVAGETEIYGVHVDPATGDPVGSRVRISTQGADGDPDAAAQHPAVAYRPDTGEYMVVWQGTAILGEYEIYGARVAASDLSVTSVGRLTNAGTDGDPAVDALTPDVAFNSAASEYHLVWHGTDGGESEIYGQRMSGTGAVQGSPQAVSSIGPAGNADWEAVHPDVDYSPASNLYVVAWSGSNDTTGGVAGEREIYVQRIDASGSEIGADDQRISQAGTDGDATVDAVRPALRIDPEVNEAFVVWSSNVADGRTAFDVYAQRLDVTTGSEVGTNDVRLSTMGSDGDVAFSGFATAVSGLSDREYYVLWRGDDTLDDAYDVYGQQVYARRSLGDEDGTDDGILSGLSQGSSDYGAVTPVLASNGQDAYLAVWSGDTTADVFVEGEHEIFGRILAPSSVLPVELTGFQATTGPDGIRLVWTTATETNNAGFDVQRRMDRPGGDWTVVGRVKGAGTTTSAQTYRFTDSDLPYAADRFVYRLRQVDLDGTASFSDDRTVSRQAVTAVELPPPFPNPARGEVQVQFSIPQTRTGGATPQLRLFDVLGRVVRDVRVPVEGGRNQITVDLQGIAPGMYFLRLTAADQVRTRKVMVVQ